MTLIKSFTGGYSGEFEAEIESTFTNVDIIVEFVNADNDEVRDSMVIHSWHKSSVPYKVTNNRLNFNGSNGILKVRMVAIGQPQTVILEEQSEILPVTA